MGKRIFLIGCLFELLAGIAPLAAQVPTRPPALISLSANGETAPRVRQGWPMVIEANLMHRDVFDENVTAVSISAPWSGALQLKTTDDGGSPVFWTFHPASLPSGSLVLDGEAVGELGWWLTPAETAAIAPGSYVITAYLDSLAVQAPFDGLSTAKSRPVYVEVLPPEASPAEDEVALRQLLLADYFVLSGDEASALGAIDDLLSIQPANIAALTYRGQLLRMDGRLVESLDTYGAAANAFAAANPDPQEPPTLLLNEYLEVQAEIQAMKSFEVAVAPKTPLHPYFGEGNSDGFLISGVEGGELWLYEDSTYTFTMVNVPAAAAFYFSTSAVGGGADVYSDGVDGQPGSGNDVVTFTPNSTTPDLLYYQSMNELNMGWQVHIIRDASVTGVEPSPVSVPLEYRLDEAYPNPFSAETRITLSISRPQKLDVILYDVRGQEVRTIFDDVVPVPGSREFVISGEGLASGMYIVRFRGETFSAARGLILVR